MQDRVADVLAQRARLDTGGAGGVVLSILLHGAIAGAAVYAAMHAEAPQVASTLNIRFAPMPAPVVAPPAEPKPAAPPRIEPPKPEPVKPAETKKAPEKNTVPLSPFGKSSKKGSENPAPPPRPTTNDQRPAGATATAPGVSAAFEGGDFPYTIYIDRMRTLIGTHWFRPQIGAGATTVVYFVIERDGTIRDAKTEVPSGNDAVDRAALRAILEANPLPPLPFGYAGTYLGVHLTFR
ncbi:MAG TPA: energy transducer TonB [Thermoanaerobaculia bacterium]|nr:energy transducer TonB [Thermoanaerobaculia bacterium]